MLIKCINTSPGQYIVQDSLGQLYQLGDNDLVDEAIGLIKEDFTKACEIMGGKECSDAANRKTAKR